MIVLRKITTKIAEIWKSNCFGTMTIRKWVQLTSKRVSRKVPRNLRAVTCLTSGS